MCKQPVIRVWYDLVGKWEVLDVDRKELMGVFDTYNLAFREAEEEAARINARVEVVKAELDPKHKFLDTIAEGEFAAEDRWYV